MAIRFRCAQCKQPIEVDDELADKMARCPFCDSVISVPANSEFGGREIATARPAGGAIPPPPASYGGYSADARPDGSMPGAPTKPSQFGKAAMVCAICMAMCIAALAVRGAQRQSNLPASQPTNFQDMMQQMSDASDQTQMAISLLAAFFSLTATGLGLISLARKERPTWPAWVGIGSGGPFLLCQCIGGILVALMAGSSGI
ncbi:MAG: hypothetical protein AB7N71_10030 [Phycisphaerae bacterium]